MEQQEKGTVENVKEQYNAKNIPLGQPPMTPEQEKAAREQTKKEWETQMKQMKEELPYLKMRAEYEDLQLKIMENAVLLGQRPIVSLPVGLFRSEMMEREVRSMGFLAGWQNEMENAKREQQGKEDYDKANAESAGKE